jgi:hypothetical protein
MKMKFFKIILLMAASLLIFSPTASVALENKEQASAFDDTNILDEYTREYEEEAKETIIGRINDDTINVYQSAAAIRVFKEKFSQSIVGREKILIEQELFRRLNQTTSPFVEVEIMHTLCVMDRYRYFDGMVPALILKLDHYNGTVNQMAESALDDIIAKGKGSARDARIIFNTLRKVFFLSRNTYKGVTQPNPRLSKKLKLVRWSVKILGAQEVKKLPKDIMHLL